MVKLVVMFKRPEDPEEFERLYRETHLPLARQMPGLRRMELSRFTGVPGGGDPPYYRMAELYFDSMDALNASMASEPSREAAKNLMSFAKGIVSMSIAEVDE
ncbi:MAG: EthD family reductase [Clostridia bacterium]|nr:EthD family reductase [Clostridia bacterium]